VSSSGLIYAGIVGAWAVYLVPVWLRREEQLNEAREKARYAAAIRTLGRSERFEKKVLAEESLAATGTDGALGPRAGDGSTPEKPAPRKTTVLPTPASVESVKQKPALKPKPSAAAQPRKGVTAHLPHHQQPAAKVTKPTTKPTAKPSPAATAARRRGVLLMRRRRVVAALFTLATLGAVVSTFLGLDYIWAMLAPAALFSGYVVYIRRDEKQRARERFRRRQAALVAERRRERQRQGEHRTSAPATPATPVDAVVREPESTVWRPAQSAQSSQSPHEYRRAANG
jgi:type II secretory pathway pseudopilin PulG